LRTLIINGSPRTGGDTAALVCELRRCLIGEIEEISAYRAQIAPCVDCRACRSVRGCVINDDMSIIYEDGFDNVVIASPVYYSNLTGPLISLMSRFQPVHNARYYLGDPIQIRPKKGGLILCAGGKGNESGEVRSARTLFKLLNAAGFEERTVISKNTDNIPAAEDKDALAAVRRMAASLLQ